MTVLTPPVRILVATGATGGHLFPALSLIETFQTVHPEAEAHLVLNRMPDFAGKSAANRKVFVHTVEIRPPQMLFSLMVFKILIEYVQAFWKVARLLHFLKPKVVIGFGSFASVPSVLYGACLGIPVVLHEQNASAGRANRFLSYWADRIGASFPETAGLPAAKTIWTGFPVRASILNARRAPESAPDRQKPFTVLVFGGSQGARSINTVFLEALKLFRPEEKAQFAVIHIIGSGEVEAIRRMYQVLGIDARVLQFSYEIEKDLLQADLVICRAGAGTIFELATVGRASILIPYPFAYAHQEINGAYLAKRGWARVLYERELTAGALLESLRDLRMNVSERQRMERGIGTLACPDAAMRLMEITWKL